MFHLQQNHRFYDDRYIDRESLADDHDDSGSALLYHTPIFYYQYHNSSSASEYCYINSPGVYADNKINNTVNGYGICLGAASK